MGTKQLTEKKKGTFKDKMIKDVALVLSRVLPDIKENLGEKKFEKRIQKAARLLSGGIKSDKSASAVKIPASKSSARLNKAKPKVASPAKKTARKTASK